MEIKETRRNHNWIKGLIIITLGILLAMIYSLRTDATGLNNKVYERKLALYDSEGNHIKDQVNIFSYQTDNPNETYCYLYTAGADDGYTKTYILYSFEPISIKTNFIQKYINLDGSEEIYTDVQNDYDSSTANKYILSDGRSVYVYNLQYEQYPESSTDIVRMDYVDKYHFPDLSYTDIRNVLERIVTQQVEPEIKYIPDIDLSDIDSTGVYSEYIPTPKITVDNVGYGFGFNNAADNYYFELQGRWYSVDDIELFKENLQWKYKYSTLIKSSLTSWVCASDKLLATDEYDFADLGENAFESFLTSYPVDNRTYYGGTNAVGNYFSGYNNAMDTIKMLLNAPESLFNGLEIYIRYFTIDDDGNVNYGKWCHWYDALADAGGSSGSEIDDKQNMHSESQSESGLTTEQKESLEETGDSKSDTDVITQYINNSPDEIASQKIWDVMQSMISAMGVFPSLVSTVFGWLPSWFINMIAVSLASLIILRFLGR